MNQIAKIIAIIVGILILSAVGFCVYKVVNKQPPCTDSDGGNNPFVKGETFGEKGTSGEETWTDYCAGNTLREYFCTSEYVAERDDIKCQEEYGTDCFEGVCLQ